MRLGLEKFYDLVEAFESLPTIGKKSAQRLAYHIIMNDNYCGLKIAHSIENAITSIKKCTLCGSMSEHEICEICLDDDRHSDTVCVVQSAKDIFMIEESKQYNGKYFVIEKIDKEHINQLIDFVKLNDVKEIFFAITPSISNDGFVLYIEEKLSGFNITFSKIAQGIPTGVSLENVDMLSLAKAIKGKTSIN